MFSLVATGGMQPGDVVLQVGPAPVEGAMVLANEAANRLGDVPRATLNAARRALSSTDGAELVEAQLLGVRAGHAQAVILFAAGGAGAGLDPGAGVVLEAGLAGAQLGPPR